jgi:RNA recognition motif-containing protein
LPEFDEESPQTEEVTRPADRVSPGTLQPAATAYVSKETTMKKLFVGNFSFSTTESDLRNWFEPHGAVENATVVTDRDTGRSRGFGFVEMTSGSEADAAIAALNGSDVDGRPLTVNEARAKSERSGGGGFGGGRGGGFGGGRGGGGGFGGGRGGRGGRGSY